MGKPKSKTTKAQSTPDFDWNTLELEKSDIPQCDHFGCDREGLYPAPKSLNRPQDRYYFCLEHIKAYNDQWDYAEEIKKAGGAFDPEKTDPHMPHNPFKSAFSRARFRRGNTSPSPEDTASGYDPSHGSTFHNQGFHDPHEILGNDHGFNHQPKFSTPKHFSPKTPEGRAFKILELDWPFVEADLKQAYKNLAKKHHPDLNQQSSESLEKFREIKEAYELLSTLLKTVYG